MNLVTLPCRKKSWNLCFYPQSTNISSLLKTNTVSDIRTDSESILNGTLNTKLNRLYQCQSNIIFITILGHCLTTYPESGSKFTTYPGRGVVLQHTRVGAQFYDIPGSKTWALNHLISDTVNNIYCNGVQLEEAPRSNGLRVDLSGAFDTVSYNNLLSNINRSHLHPDTARLPSIIKEVDTPRHVSEV